MTLLAITRDVLRVCPHDVTQLWANMKQMDRSLLTPKTSADPNLGSVPDLCGLNHKVFTHLPQVWWLAGLHMMYCIVVPSCQTGSVLTARIQVINTKEGRELESIMLE